MYISTADYCCYLPDSPYAKTELQCILNIQKLKHTNANVNTFKPKCFRENFRFKYYYYDHILDARKMLVGIYTFAILKIIIIFILLFYFLF